MAKHTPSGNTGKHAKVTRQSRRTFLTAVPAAVAGAVAAKTYAQGQQPAGPVKPATIEAAESIMGLDFHADEETALANALNNRLRAFQQLRQSNVPFDTEVAQVVEDGTVQLSTHEVLRTFSARMPAMVKATAPTWAGFPSWWSTGGTACWSPRAIPRPSPPPSVFWGSAPSSGPRWDGGTGRTRRRISAGSG